MTLKLENNAVSNLASPITSVETTLTVMPGEGARFPSLTAGQWFPLTLVDVTGKIEIVKCTARTDDTFTITRGQEGTAQGDFAAGSRVELRATRDVYDTFVAKDSTATTGAALIPAGTEAQRPANEAPGMFRFNSDIGKFEGRNNAGWGSVGGGATGGGADEVFILNSQLVTEDFAIPAGKNAGTFGPIEIAAGVTVEVPPGSTWTVV